MKPLISVAEPAPGHSYGTGAGVLKRYGSGSDPDTGVQIG
jgi:hypothetical protein